MAEQILHGSNVETATEQGRRERVAQGMRSRNWPRTLTERSDGNGVVLVFMACYDCFFLYSLCLVHPSSKRVTS